MSPCTPTPRVLVDTDPGLDDTCALLTLLQAHQQRLIRVVAITTVHGNAALAHINKNLVRLLDALKVTDIPLHSGAASPLVPPFLRQPPEPYHGEDGFGATHLPVAGDWAQRFEAAPAAQAIVEHARRCQEDGGLHVLALGPLTNLALARALDPPLLTRLESLHIMGGNLTAEGNMGPCGEFNFECDPEAARMVLSRRVGGEGEGEEEEEDEGTVCITPWETCKQSTTFTKEYRQWLGSPPCAPGVELLNRAEEWNAARRPDWTTCDQLAAAWLLDQLVGDQILPLQERPLYSPLAAKVLSARVTVECQGSHTRGQMVVDRRGQVPHSLPVCLLQELNLPLFKHYLELTFGKK